MAVHHSNRPGLPCLEDPVLSQAARNRVQRPPNSHSRDLRHKEWPLHGAFHLTSHHLLGFIRLHVSIVLHHLLQPCLATSHLRRIEGICIVLQDSQLEEEKGRRRVRVLTAFLRWVKDQLKRLETTPQALLAAARAAAGTPSLHHGSPAEQVLAAGGFPGTGAWPWKCSSLCPESWDRAKQSRRRPSLLPYHRLGAASARAGTPARPPPWCGAAGSAVPLPWHADALPACSHISSPEAEKGRRSYRGVSWHWHNWELAGYFPGLPQAHLKTFLIKGLRTAYIFLFPPSQAPIASTHMSQVTEDRAPPCDQGSPGSRTRSFSSAMSRGRHKKPKVCPH